MENKYFIIKFDDNYADEFDISGFSLFMLESDSKILNALISKNNIMYAYILREFFYNYHHESFDFILDIFNNLELPSYIKISSTYEYLSGLSIDDLDNDILLLLCFILEHGNDTQKNELLSNLIDYEFYFGTNEFISFNNINDIKRAYSIEELSKDKYDTISEVLGTSYGTTILM